MSGPRLVCRVIFLVFFLVFPGCREKPPEALGTLEWDINRGRAPASEVITEIFVREGDPVTPGQPILQLDDRKQKAVVERLRAEFDQAEWHLKELVAGPREETISELKARIIGAESALQNSERIYKRQRDLFENNFTSRELLDIAENRYAQAGSSLAVLKEQLRELNAGTRQERIEQARAKTKIAEAELLKARLLLEDFMVKAGRQGVVEQLPYKVGDRPNAQAVVTTIMVGQRPWARIYVPEPHRSRVLPGKVYRVRVDGQKQIFSARLRYISVKPSFTPYYALSERDRSRLVYVGEFTLEDGSADSLTAGTPVQLLLEEL